MSKSERLESLIKKAEGLPPVPVAVVDAGEIHVMEGAHEAAEHNILEPILIGDEKTIRQQMGEVFCKPERTTVIHANSEQEAAEIACKLVLEGKAQAIMKGRLHTDVLLKAVLQHLRTGKRISHVFVADLPSYHKPLYITDAAINIQPDLATKAAILQNAIDLAKYLGVDTPKAAILSAVEVVNPAIPSTIDAACLSKMTERGQIRGGIVDGPLAFDNAISAKSAEIKGIESAVSGDVDILLVPDLVSGNILAKDLEYLANAQLAGLVMGAKVPIILTSRSDPAHARMASAALAALVYHHNAEAA